MSQITWLVLAHQVPANPSKKRVYVWRKLKEMGATYFKQGVAMLPKSPTNLSLFQSLLVKIEEMGGDVTMAELRFISAKDELKAISEFREQSRKEYNKIIKEITLLNRDVATGIEDPLNGAEKAKRMEKKLSQILSRDHFMSRKEPEVSDFFDDLLKDMSMATHNLAKHFKNKIN